MQMDRLLRGLAIVGATAGLTGPQNLALSPPTKPVEPSLSPIKIAGGFTPSPGPETIAKRDATPAPQDDGSWTLRYETSLSYPLRPGPALQPLDIRAMVRETLAELNRPPADYYDTALEDAMIGIMRGRDMSAYLKRESSEDQIRLKKYDLNFKLR